ncbi:MAG: 4Fe-4S dicluster domain-containing protein [Deltaproteobacteria bacterium]|nr:4Fe-4S dicluster domain-containing protein [Candidatus Kapabacteria bacterium]
MKMTIARFDPETDEESRYEIFDLPELDRATVLQGLMYVYDNVDSTLGFSFNCRYKNCGLCGLTIDGRPHLACLTPLVDGTVVEPLRNLPLLRDLIIDRRDLFADLRTLTAYIPESVDSRCDAAIHEPAERAVYMQCVECLVCMASCPEYQHGDSAFAGPMVFVKLMQLHLDPRDASNRREQARQLGVEICLECAGCACPSNIPIRKGAIAGLLATDN